MDQDSKQLWVDKYRPRKLKDLVLSQDIKQYFKNMLKSGNILNATFSGPPGIGKSTICRVIAEELGAEMKFIPCAVKGNVATAQGELKDFCDAMTFDGKLKIVILDEVDSASATTDSSFQKALRNIIEAAQSDTRFLLNCNYVEKVISPIKSRCPVINLSFDKRDLLYRIKGILEEEKIEYVKDDLKAFLEVAFNFYPDIRQIINCLQGCCTSGKLVVSQKAISDVEKENFIADLVKKTLEARNLLDVRQHYIRCKSDLSDYIDGASQLFNYVVDNGIVSSPEGVLKLTDLVYQINMVVDKEPTFFGMLTAVKAYSGN